MDIDHLADDERYNPVFVRLANENKTFFETGFFRTYLHIWHPFRKLLRERKLGIPKVLSVPCSTGQEAYSIAISCLEEGLSPEIYAVDKEMHNITRAIMGSYDPEDVRNIPGNMGTGRYVENEFAIGMCTVRPEVKKYINFMNGDVLAKDFFKLFCAQDYVFCLNLLPYLSDGSRVQVVNGIKGVLKDDGVLILEPDLDTPTKNKQLEDELLKYREFRESLRYHFDMVYRENILIKKTSASR